MRSSEHLADRDQTLTWSVSGGAGLPIADFLQVHAVIADCSQAMQHRYWVHGPLARCTGWRLIMMDTVAVAKNEFLLKFASLFTAGRSLSFPCDAKGAVALDRLSDRARNNYFFARVTVGRDFANPVVEPALH